MKKRISLLLMVAFLIPLLGLGQDPEGSIHAAALQGNSDVIRQYINTGSDLDQRDAYGSTPLIIATTFGKTKVAKELIAAGADLEISNNEGSTPLLIAALFGRTEIVRMLLDNGANRFSRNIEGSTAYDIVSAPFSEDKALYDQLGAGLGPLGLTLDYEQINRTRPEIAAMLYPTPEELKTVDYTPLEGGNWKVSTPAEQGLNPALVAELYIDAANLETVYSVLLIKNGHLVAEKYFNEGKIDQKARLQSVTKSFTSALVGLALEQGCLESTDQKMLEFFPELIDQINDPRKEQITIRHLLQMRAGYPWEESTQDLFEILYSGFRPSTLAEIPLNRDPGTEFQYSNLSSHILGIIVARACKTDLKSFAQAHLFAPLQIEPGKWIQDWEGYYNGHADLHLTARDAAKFGLMYLDKGKYNETRVLPARWIGESLQYYSENVNSSGTNHGSVGRYLREIGYGYQWWSASIDGYRFNLAWGHGGQFIFLLDEYDMVVVVTSDPLFGQHDGQAWRHERANINLVGKFIKSLPGE